jgi:hypothetical protein
MGPKLGTKSEKNVINVLTFVGYSWCLVFQYISSLYRGELLWYYELGFLVFISSFVQI